MHIGNTSIERISVTKQIPSNELIPNMEIPRQNYEEHKKSRQYDSQKINNSTAMVPSERVVWDARKRIEKNEEVFNEIKEDTNKILNELKKIQRNSWIK